MRDCYGGTLHQGCFRRARLPIVVKRKNLAASASAVCICSQVLGAFLIRPSSSLFCFTSLCPAFSFVVPDIIFRLHSISLPVLRLGPFQLAGILRQSGSPSQVWFGNAVRQTASREE